MQRLQRLRFGRQPERIDSDQLALGFPRAGGPDSSKRSCIGCVDDGIKRSSRGHVAHLKKVFGLASGGEANSSHRHNTHGHINPLLARRDDDAVDRGDVGVVSADRENDMLI